MIANVTLRNWKGLTGSWGLGPRTILVGENGSGKTAILEAMQVGLTGYTALGKLPKAVLALASDKVTEITLEDDAGNIVTRKFEKVGPGGRQTVTINGETVAEKDLGGAIPASMTIPVEAIHPYEFLGMSGDRRAAWLFDAIGGDVTRVTPDQFTVNPEWFKEPMAANDLVEKIKADVKTTKAELERCVALIQKLTGEAGTMPAGTRNEWEKKLVEAEKEHATALQAQAANAERVRLSSTKAEYRQRMENNIKLCHAKIEEAEKKLVELRAKISEVSVTTISIVAARKDIDTWNKAATEGRARAAELRRRITSIQAGCCPTCGTKADALSGAIEDWDMEATSIEMDADDAAASAKDLADQIANAEEAARATDRNNAINTEIRLTSDGVKSYKASMEKYQSELDELNEDAGASEAADPALLLARVEGAKGTMLEARAAIDKFKTVEVTRAARTKAEASRQSLEQHMADMKDLQKDVKAYADKALESLTGKILEPFQLAASKAFGCDAFLEILGSNDKPTVDFGIENHDGKRISFDTMSGGEKAIILAALVGALQIATGGTIRKPKILLAELAEADQARIGAFLSAVNDIGFEQVVVATCHGQLIPSEIPGGADVVTMEKGCNAEEGVAF